MLSEINYGYCICGNTLETVAHFLLHCKLWEKYRIIMKNEIMFIFILNNIPWNLNNILFPSQHLMNRHRKQILDFYYINLLKVQRD